MSDSTSHCVNFVYTGKGPVPQDVTHVRIDPSAKEIGQQEFQGRRQLVEVVLHEELQRIKMHAFKYCTSLQHIRVPSSVKVIDEGAFACCKNLVEVELCNGLEQIERRAFCHLVENIQRIKIPSTVKVIDESAFAACYRLEVLDLSEGLEQVYPDAFYLCSYFTGLKFLLL